MAGTLTKRQQEAELERISTALIKLNSVRGEEYPAHDNRYFRRQDRRNRVEQLDETTTEARSLTAGYSEPRMIAICRACGMYRDQYELVIARCNGETNQAIADMLGVSEGRVRQMLQPLLRRIVQHRNWWLYVVIGEVFGMHPLAVWAICAQRSQRVE